MAFWQKFEVDFMGTLSFFMLFLVDPLFMAFMSSVAIGAFFKNIQGKLFVKRIVSLSIFGAYFILGAFAYYYFSFIAKCIVMFAPFVLFAVILVVSLIVAPKGEIVKDKSDYKMTGWDSMFPNDIDN